MIKNLKIYAEYCEMYFGLGMTILDIALAKNTDIITVSKAIDIYKKKENQSLKLQSILNSDTQADKFIIENWDKMPVLKISQALKTYKSWVARRGIKLGMHKKKPIYRKGFFVVQSFFIILNQETGIYYVNASEAARAVNINIRTCQWRLQRDGKYKQLIKA